MKQNSQNKKTISPEKTAAMPKTDNQANPDQTKKIRPRSKINRILYVAASTIVILALLVLFFVSLLKNSAQSAAHAYLGLVSQGQFDQSYNDWFSGNYKTSITATDYDLNMQVDNSLLGTFLSRDVNSSSLQIDWKNGQIHSTINYFSAFDKDKKASETVELTRSIFENNWRIDQYQIQSMLMLQY